MKHKDKRWRGNLTTQMYRQISNVTNKMVETCVDVCLQDTEEDAELETRRREKGKMTKKTMTVRLKTGYRMIEMRTEDRRDWRTL